MKILGLGLPIECMVWFPLPQTDCRICNATSLERHSTIPSKSRKHKPCKPTFSVAQNFLHAGAFYVMICSYFNPRTSDVFSSWFPEILELFMYPRLHNWDSNICGSIIHNVNQPCGCHLCSG